MGAFIVPEGLGAPIFSGLREFFQTKFVVAGALAVGLALIADVLIVLLGRALTPWARAGGRRSAETFRPGVFVDGVRFVGDNPG